nr:hypothetical protein [Paraflavitalea speifideiaquila]
MGIFNVVSIVQVGIPVGRAAYAPGIKQEVGIIVAACFRTGKLVIEDIPAFYKERATFCEEVLEAINTYLRGIRFYLSKIRVDGKVEDQVIRNRQLPIQARS